jgi:hypothetical protein
MAVVRKLLRGSSAEFALLKSHADEPFFGVQLADNKPDSLAEGARLAESRGARFVDLNCGCPIHEITRRGLKFRWKCETRPDCVNEETLRAMAAAGCEGINFGVESADVQIQANVGRKPITQEKILEMVALCRKLHIKTFCFFIIGLPGDTLRTILSTIEFAIRLRPNWIQFTAASPLVGTELRDCALGQGLVVEDDYAYRSSHEAMIGNENLTKDQVAALHRFTLFLERYLLNRGGVLKDATRTDRIYTTARRVADAIGHGSARLAFAIARSRFEQADFYSALIDPSSRNHRT